MNQQTIQYRFEDSITMLRFIFVSNFIIAMLLMAGGSFNNSNGFRISYCLIAAVLYLIPYLFYNWQSVRVNTGLLIILLSLLGAELLHLGIPNSPIEIQQQISKGIMFDMLVSIFPYIYIGIKLFALLPASHIIMTSYKKMKTSEASFIHR